MDLPDSLVKQFTEITNDEPKKEQDNECYGTVTSNGKVLLDGSSTPLSCKKIVNTNEGDRVLVNIKNHQATIIGNLTSPAADSETTNNRINAAITSANGKNKLFHQSTAPTASDGLTPGDIWFDTGNDCHIHTWTGAEWSAFELGEDAIADLAITNAKIADATIQHGKIATLDVGKVVTGKLAAQYINVAELFAQNIIATNKFQVDTEQLKLAVESEGFYLHTEDTWQNVKMEAGIRCRCTKGEVYRRYAYVDIFGDTGIDITTYEQVSLSGEYIDIQADKGFRVLSGVSEFHDSVVVSGDLKVTGNITGTASNATQATNATKATNDSNGNKIAPTNFYSSVSVPSSESPSHYRFVKYSNMVSIVYQGASKTHSVDDRLFTLPSGYRPSSDIYFPFVKNSSAYGFLKIEASSGKCTVGSISSTSVTGRIYFSVSYDTPASS